MLGVLFNYPKLKMKIYNLNFSSWTFHSSNNPTVS